MKSFCYLGYRLNASGGSEAAATARMRIEWIKLRECGKLLYGRKFLLKMKKRIYQNCIRSAMLYGSETWCLKENKMAILRRTEKARMRAICGVKMIEKRSSRELGDVLRRAVDFEVAGRRGHGQPNLTWKRQV